MPRMSVRESTKKRLSTRKKVIDYTKTTLVTMAAVTFAFIFLMPIILTITNSFMSSSEISSNYGSIFATSEKGGKVFVSKVVNFNRYSGLLNSTV